jgi:hypothetical protein
MSAFLNIITSSTILCTVTAIGARGGAVVEALHYKPGHIYIFTVAHGFPSFFMLDMQSVTTVFHLPYIKANVFLYVYFTCECGNDLSGCIKCVEFLD